MPLFRVYQVCEETVLRRWQYDVEADDEDQALIKAANEEVQACHCDTHGDTTYGESGWAVREKTGDDDLDTDTEAFDEAAENI